MVGRPIDLMQITDAQIHLWSQGLPVNKAHRQVTSFLADEAIQMMDTAGVDAAIMHPVGWDPNSQALAEAAVCDYPGRFAIMGTLPLDRAISEPMLATWRDRPGMLGTRYTFVHRPEQDWLEQNELDWLWSGAEKAGIPVSMMATHSLDAVGRMAERYPGLRITIDHFGGLGGFTTLKDHAAMTHMPALLRLARLPNVAVKVTGAPGYSAEAWPFPIMLGYLEQLYDAFGPSRLFWGTDITKMPCSWQDCITMVTDAASWLPKADQPLIMGQAIRDWWGWQGQATASS